MSERLASQRGAILLAAVVAAAIPAVAGVQDDKKIVERIYGERSKEPWKLQFKQGTVARGVIVNESGQTLYLDGDPCTGKSVYQFTQPFDKAPTGKKVTCDGAELTEYQVKQR